MLIESKGAENNARVTFDHVLIDFSVLSIWKYYITVSAGSIFGGTPTRRNFPEVCTVF